MRVKKLIELSTGPLLGGFLGFITVPIIAWYYPVEDVARFSLLLVTINLSISLFSLGMHQAYVREFYEEINKNKLFKTAFLPGIFVSSVACIVILIFPISQTLFSIDSNQVSFFLIIAIFSSYLINFMNHSFRMLENIFGFTLSIVFPRTIILFLILFFTFLNVVSDFRTLALIQALALLITTLVLLSIYKKSFINYLKEPFDKTLMKKMFKFSLPLAFGALFHWALVNTDKFLLSFLASLDELGIYAMAVSLASGLTLFSMIFANIWHPILYKWVSEGVNAERVFKTFEYVFLFVITSWSMVGIFSWCLLFFLPDEYRLVEFLFIACIGMPLFYLLSETSVVGINIQRKTLFSMFITVFSLITNLILNYFLIPLYGASGAAVSSLISFFIFFVARTEASSFLWKSFPRMKIYLICAGYLITTITIVLNQINLFGLPFIWIGLLFITYLIYSNRILELLKFLKMK